MNVNAPSIEDRYVSAERQTVDMESGVDLDMAVEAGWLAKQLGTNLTDPRTNGWFLTDPAWPMSALIAVYLIVCITGPKLMAPYKPFHLKQFIILYNAALVALSLYMFIEVLAVTIFNPNFGSFLCNQVDYSEDPSATRLLNVIWIYFISKAVEFVETVVFILRKKNNQITFLHVYHHSTMVFLWWLVARHVAGGSAYFSMMVNSFTHVVMYTYYLLSALGDRMKPFLWWKKYLTGFQLVQFWVVSLHISINLCTGCEYPQGYSLLLLIYMFTQKILFMNFYNKTYRNKKLGEVGDSLGDVNQYEITNIKKLD